MRHLMNKQSEILKSRAQALSKTSEDSECVVLHFLFQKANLEVEGTANAALRSVLVQFISQVPRLFPFLLWRYEHLTTKGSAIWSWDLLWSVFRDMLDHVQSQSTIFMVFDAVDECEVDSRTMFLEHVSFLISDKGMKSLPGSGIVKVMVTSRQKEQISDTLSAFTCININDQDSAPDMELFIRSSVERLSALRHLGAAVSDMIHRFLETNAQGMFLWVALILTELERRDQRLTNETIISRLSSVPLTLANIYASVLNDVPQSRHDDLWRILRWLAFGRRVLTLTELEGALCEEICVTNWYDLSGDIRFLCGSLVRIDDNEEVQFVHETAREFILDQTRKYHKHHPGDINMDPLQAEAGIAMTSIKFMLRRDVMEIIKGVVALLHVTSLHEYFTTIDLLLQSKPFLCYAVQHWAGHLRQLGRPEMPLYDLTLEFLDSELRRDAVMRLTHFFTHSGSPSAPVGASKLHLASYFNLPWLVETYLAQGMNPNLVSCMGDTPLIWAAEMGSLEPVKLLLRSGSEPTKTEVDGWTPLHWAARNGHAEIAELLLQSGAKADAQDWRKTRPIDWAITGGHHGVIAVMRKYSVCALSFDSTSSRLTPVSTECK